MAVHSATECADAHKSVRSRYLLAKDRTSSDISTCASDTDPDGRDDWSDDSNSDARRVTFANPRFNEHFFFETAAVYQAWKPEWWLDRRARARKLRNFQALKGGFLTHEDRMTVIAAEDAADERIRMAVIAAEDIDAESDSDDDRMAILAAEDFAADSDAVLPCDGNACEDFDLKDVIVNMWGMFEMTVLPRMDSESTSHQG